MYRAGVADLFQDFVSEKESNADAPGGRVLRAFACSAGSKLGTIVRSKGQAHPQAHQHFGNQYAQLVLQMSVTGCILAF
eukprot:s4182_g3.t1